MDNPSEEPTAVTDPRSPPPSRARRRLIQSTLFPHTPLDQDDKKPTTQQKPKSRASNEVVVTKAETPSKEIDEEEDSHQLNNDMKSPQKWKRRSSATPEKSYSSATPEKRRTTATPKKRGASGTPEKWRKNSTPKKKLLVSGLNDGCAGQMNNPVNGEHASQLVPDLRLEAKLQAEENSRIYGGKQIHPFFSSWKSVKKNQERTDEESDWSSVDKKGQSITFSPIHVFEQVKDDDLSLDWGNWIFPERSDGTSFDLKSESSANYERTVKALNFDNFKNVSGCQNDGSSHRYPIQVDKVPLHQSPIRQDYIHSAASVVLTDEQVTDHERSIGREENHTTSKIDLYTGDASCGQYSDVKYGDLFFGEK